MSSDQAAGQALGWKCIETDGTPKKLGRSCYAVWNGGYWINASLLPGKHGAIQFLDYHLIPIKRATHYIYIGNGPDNADN